MKPSIQALHEDEEFLADESNDRFFIDTSHLITEDDKPVDNVFSDHQQRLLVEPLYSSLEVWNADKRSFVANADVGVFIANRNPAIVPDAFISMDVENTSFDESGKPIPPDFTKIRSYFVWEYGKVPDVVVEVVSNRVGGELSRKMRDYAKMHVPYYVVFDPFEVYKGEKLRIFKLAAYTYEPYTDFWFEEVGLGIRLWEGEYEAFDTTWLRWCDERGNVVPTGAEGVRLAKEKTNHAENIAFQEHERAEQERERAEQERERANRLAEKLRAIGINPDEV
jgi:Uma2 family endonuclease